MRSILAQIYPTLKQLEANGWVTSALLQQGGRPDKRLYAITPQGQAALRTWLNEPLDQLPLKKDAVLLKLFFSGSLDKGTLLEQLRRQLALHKAQWERYQTETKACIQESVARSGLQREGVLWELVRDYGAGHEQHYIRWLEQAIQTVEASL